MFKINKIITFLLFSFIIFYSSLWAQTSETPSAASMLSAAQKRMYTLKDQSGQLTFRIIDVNGSEDRSVYKMFWKNYAGQDGFNSKSLFETELPIEDKGKKYLVWEYVEEDQTDQWIYLPELRQVRRVHANRHKHEGEVASDLLMEDIRQRRIEKDTHHFLPETEVKGEPSYVIENRPIADGPYGKTIMYLSKKDGTLRKADYFSEKGVLLKNLWIEWEQIAGNFVWKRSEMMDAQTGHKTILELSDTQIDTGLRDNQFSDRALRR